MHTKKCIAAEMWWKVPWLSLAHVCYSVYILGIATLTFIELLSLPAIHLFSVDQIIAEIYRVILYEFWVLVELLRLAM